MDVVKSFTFQAILNATVSVDTFFLLRFVIWHFLQLTVFLTFKLFLVRLNNRKSSAL